MKTLVSFFLFVAAGFNAVADNKRCVAKEVDKPQTSIPFYIEEGAEGARVVFEQKVAWYAEALEFEILYSGEIENTYFIAGRSLAAEKPQMIELSFEDLHMERGSLRAGDLISPMNRLGKRRDFKVQCF